METTYPKIAFQAANGMVFVRKNEIIHAEAAGNYTLIYLTNNRSVRVLRKLKEVHELLPDDNFIRIHRSHLINLEHVVNFEKIEKDTILLNDETTVTVSRNRRNHFLEKFTKI